MPTSNKVMKADSVQSLYDGKVKLEYQDKSHKYLVSKLVKAGLYTEPTPVTGITTIIGIINKYHLIQGAVNKTLEFIKEQPELTPAMFVEAKTAYSKQWRKGADIGTLGHTLVEALLRGKEIKLPDNKELATVLENIAIQYEQFMMTFEPKTIHVEQPMYSLIHNFAGTDDYFCEINGKKIVVDFKTSNRSFYSPDGIYANNFAQLGGQIILIEEQFGEVVEDAWIVNLAKDSTEFKFKRLSDLNMTPLDAKLYFLACLQLYEMNKLFEWRMK